MNDTMTADEFNALKAKPKPKYGNQKTEVDGVMFDSKAEAKRYKELKHLLDEGEIQSLILQPKYPIVVYGEKICTYIGDFRYRFFGSDVEIVEDVKGVRTPSYRLKKKLMRAVHGIDIVEV